MLLPQVVVLVCPIQAFLVVPCIHSCTENLTVHQQQRHCNMPAHAPTTRLTNFCCIGNNSGLRRTALFLSSYELILIDWTHIHAFLWVLCFVACTASRYETFWLNFMENELALCPGTLVVAHGTSADAVLRFVERRQASPDTHENIVFIPLGYLSRGNRNDTTTKKG